jgi:acetylornithine deacetylase/succinyl-diaminopimelate desuccinylase-like protein
MTDTEALLRELIAMPSVNPAFLPTGHPRAGEQGVSQLLADRAARLGLAVGFKKALLNRPNLLLQLSPRGKIKRRLVLAPHLDTVNANDEQFTPTKINGRLYGRGACDTKGSVAAMMCALFDLAAQGPRPLTTEIVFVGLVDEENSQSGSRAFAASGFKADLAIVGEPTGLRVVTAHKGSLWLKFETRGKSAHGAKPELGRNAVHEMSRIVDLLETEYATGLQDRRHPLLGQATVSVGVISGGTQPTIARSSSTVARCPERPRGGSRGRFSGCFAGRSCTPFARTISWLRAALWRPAPNCLWSRSFCSRPARVVRPGWIIFPMPQFWLKEACPASCLARATSPKPIQLMNGLNWRRYNAQRYCS